MFLQNLSGLANLCPHRGERGEPLDCWSPRKCFTWLASDAKLVDVGTLFPTQDFFVLMGVSFGDEKSHMMTLSVLLSVLKHEVEF